MVQQQNYGPTIMKYPVTTVKSFLIKLLLRNKKFRDPIQNVRKIFVSAGHLKISSRDDVSSSPLSNSSDFCAS